MVTILSDVELLRKLSTLRLPDLQPPSLFEAMGLLEREEPNSDLLAWLLTPNALYANNLLLMELLSFVDADLNSLPVELVDVKREVQLESGRGDIILQWEGFKVIIENKINANETNKQCSRYLQESNISDPIKGRLLYLSPKGRWPTSVKRNDPRVKAVSYKDILGLIEKVLQSKATADSKEYYRTNIILSEYARTIRVLIREDYLMNKPVISEVSNLYIQHADILKKIRNSACRETSLVLNWLSVQMKDRMADILKDDIIIHKTFNGSSVYRKDNWKKDGFVYGFCYSAESTIGEHVLNEHNHILGIHIDALEDNSSTVRESRKAMSIRLSTYVFDNWPKEEAVLKGPYSLSKNNISMNNSIWVLYVKTPYISSCNWEDWVGTVLEEYNVMLNVFVPILDSFANQDK